MTSPADLQPLTIKPRPWRRRWWWRVLRLIVGAYILLCIAVFFLQGYLIFPGSMQQGTAETRATLPEADATLHFKTASGIAITAAFARAHFEDGTADPLFAHRPTIVYFYGNAGSLAWSENELSHFQRLDCNVLIPDLAGYGESGGRPSESSFYATADACWDVLIHRADVDQKKIVTAGWSLGAAVAIHLARNRPVAGLITCNAFTRMTAMAHRTMPFLPTSLLLRHRFDNLSQMPGITCPMLICNGVQDTLVPPEMSDELARQAGGAVTRLRIASADHNSIFTAEPEVIWPAIGAFCHTIDTVDGKTTTGERKLPSAAVAAPQ